jgi:hypothetical protein
MTVQCRSCNETWSRHPAKEVPCPTCNAAIGGPCRRPSDHLCTIHVARDRLALAVTDYNSCPTGGGETVSTAARNLLAADGSLTNSLDQLDLTRADLQEVAQGTSIISSGGANDEPHQAAENDASKEPATDPQSLPLTTHDQTIQTTLTDML